MKSSSKQLSENTYDLLVIGGGIYGACVAWDAVLRGLSVALVEKGDFGGATSANSLKVIHGGFRYLQQTDFKRMRESICERRTLMRVAPHLIHPLPVLIPTYGHGKHGKEILSLALAINSLISFDRNRIDDPQKHCPGGRVMSRDEVIKALPGISRKGLTGGAVFYDGHVYNSERLTLAFLMSSRDAGAEVANYVEVVGLLKNGTQITGVEARDVLQGDSFNIKARTVVNTAGPWINRIQGFCREDRNEHALVFVKAINLVTRPLFKSYAVGIRGQENGRYLFVVPWRGHSLIGTSYEMFHGDPDGLTVTERDIEKLLNEINNAYPSAALTMDDVSFFHGGLLPNAVAAQSTGDVRLENHYRIDDCRKDGIKGLISVVGVKYTTARDVAERVVDHAFESWGRTPPKSLSSTTPVKGGHIERFNDFLQAEINRLSGSLGKDEISSLVYNYGSECREVLKNMDSSRNDDEVDHDSLSLLRAEVLYGVRNEMARKMSDIVFRRTELGTAACPHRKYLDMVAKVMADELGWDRQKQARETDEVLDMYSPLNVMEKSL